MTWDVMEEADTGVYGHWLQLLPPDELHLFHPAAFLCVARVGFRVILTSLDLQSKFLKLGPCLNAAIGGLGKTSSSSGFSLIIDL